VERGLGFELMDAGDGAVADEAGFVGAGGAPEPPGDAFVLGVGEDEIEDADAIAGLSAVGAALAGAGHYWAAGGALDAEVDHDVADGRVAFDVVGAFPEEDVAGFEVAELAVAGVFVVDLPQRSAFLQPQVNLRRVTRWVFVAELLQVVMHKPRAIEASALGVAGSVDVS
jgi:hypothetical protein